MPKFAYAAIDTAGSSVEGITKADTIGDARQILLGQNLFPTKLEEHRGSMSFELTKEKVKKKELMHFTRQLAVFVKAGITITEALETIGDETEDVALRRTLHSRGIPTLRQSPDTFVSVASDDGNVTHAPEDVQHARDVTAVVPAARRVADARRVVDVARP